MQREYLQRSRDADDIEFLGAKAPLHSWESCEFARFTENEHVSKSVSSASCACTCLSDFFLHVLEVLFEHICRWMCGCSRQIRNCHFFFANYTGSSRTRVNLIP